MHIFYFDTGINEKDHEDIKLFSVQGSFIDRQNAYQYGVGIFQEPVFTIK